MEPMCAMAIVLWLRYRKDVCIEARRTPGKTVHLRLCNNNCDEEGSNVMVRNQTHSSLDVLSQLLESDDEDDAWLDKPVFALSQQSNPTNSSSNNNATVEEEDDDGSSSAASSSSSSRKEKREEESSSQLESSSELPVNTTGDESVKDMAALLQRGAWP